MINIGMTSENNSLNIHDITVPNTTEFSQVHVIGIQPGKPYAAVRGYSPAEET
jgi:hypothetical protein